MLPNKIAEFWVLSSGLLLIEPLKKYEILIQIDQFSYDKMNVKMSSDDVSAE